MWVGGWRPSAAFHLLYSKSGLQLESRLPELLQGTVSTSNLDHLSAVQRRTIDLEREITEKWATVQEEVAAKNMVEIAEAAGEGMGGEMEEKGSVACA